MKPIIFLLLIFHSSLFCQHVLNDIQMLDLQKNEGEVPSYFSAEYENRAEEVKSLLHNSARYFEDTFCIKENFALAVLDSKAWKQITKIPYGLPFVSGPPYVVVFPATLNNELGNLVTNALKDSDLDKKYSLSNNEIAFRFISLIGFHELGHIYSKASEIKFPNKWSFEFAATYFAYLFLIDNSEQNKNLWLDVGDILEGNISPEHTSLKDFEELYVNVGVENYAWYQVIFLERVSEIAEVEGKNFIDNWLKDNSISNGNYALDDLEKLDDGFIDWAEDYSLNN